MIALSPGTIIYLAVEAVDFRCGIDGLAQCCRTVIEQDPMSGGLFAFRNRNRTAIKMIQYDGQGFWLHQKRLSSGKLAWWPTSAANAHVLTPAQLHVLLWNGDPQQANVDQLWKPIDQAA
jgi:transposase